jgi:hypothetical protein
VVYARTRGLFEEIRIEPDKDWPCSRGIAAEMDRLACVSKPETNALRDRCMTRNYE